MTSKIANAKKGTGIPPPYIKYSAQFIAPNTQSQISNLGKGPGGRRRNLKREEAGGRRGEDPPDMKVQGGLRRRNLPRIRRRQQS